MEELRSPEKQKQLFIYLFQTIFSQGCPVQRGLFEWDPDEQKKTTQKTITNKKNGTAKYSESIGGSIWLTS